MSLDSLKQQIEKIFAQERRDVKHVVRHPFGTIETIKLRILGLVGDLEKTHIIKSKEEIEELFEGIEVYYESKEIKEWFQTLKKILLGDKK